MIRNKKAAFVFGGLLAITAGVFAQTGGFPSRPNFRSVDVVSGFPVSTPSPGTIRVAGDSSINFPGVVVLSRGNTDSAALVGNFPSSTNALTIQVRSGATHNVAIDYGAGGATDTFLIPRHTYGGGLAAGGLHASYQNQNLASVVRNSVGNYTAHFTVAYTSLGPVCSVESDQVHAIISSTTLSSVTFYMLNSANAAADAVSIVSCVGT